MMGRNVLKGRNRSPKTENGPAASNYGGVTMANAVCELLGIAYPIIQGGDAVGRACGIGLCSV